MKTDEYFPQIYRQDLRQFCINLQGVVPKAGPFFMLCGRTISALLAPECREKFASPSDFLCCLYCLNLVGQGLHSRHEKNYWEWAGNAEPYLDCRACTSYHGYFLGPPNAILQTARNPMHVSGAQSVDIPAELISKYLQFFLPNYLPALMSPSFRYFENPQAFLDELKEDYHFKELAEFA